MTGSSALLAILLFAADCVTVDRCLLARSVARYSRAEISAAELRRQLSPAVVPCDPTCNPANADDDLYVAVQTLLPVLAGRLKAGGNGPWEVGIGLRRFADGGLLEDLDATLADAIQAQPRLFLLAVPRPVDRTAATIVLMLGEPFVDAGMAARCKAHRDRLAAISAVHDEDLREARDVATRALTSALEPCG